MHGNTHREAAKRNMPQIKEREKSNPLPHKKLNEMEAKNLSHIEFKTMVIRMFKELSENLNRIKKDIETIIKKQSEIKNVITDMKGYIQGNQQ